MCGRYVSATPPSRLAELLGVEDVVAEDLGPRYNVAPTMEVYAVATTRTGDLRLGTFRWGLVPSWSKDDKGGARMINARSESVATKPAFKTALLRRRCLLPADGFYEWQRSVVLNDKAGGKQPFHITMTGGGLMVFAGLWEIWRDPADPERPPLRSCSIITTAANADLAGLHDRMPVILGPDEQRTWMDHRLDTAEAVVPLLRPAPEGTTTARAVSRLVNSVKNDGPELLAEPAPAAAPGAGPAPAQLELG